MWKSHLWVKMFMSLSLITLIVISIIGLWAKFYMRDMVIYGEMAKLDNITHSCAYNLDEYVKHIESLANDIIYSKEIRERMLHPENETTVSDHIGFESAAQHYAAYLQLTNTSGDMVYDLGIKNNASNEWENLSLTGERKFWTVTRNVQNLQPYSNYRKIVSYYQKAQYLESQQIKECGWLRIDVPVTSLKSLYAALPYQGLVIDEQGKIISSTDDKLAGKMITDIYTGDFLEMLTTQSEGYIQDTEKKYYYTSAKLDGNSWRFLALTPEEELLAGFDIIEVRIVFVFFICLFSLSLLIFVNVFYITHPLRKLAKKMNSYYSSVKIDFPVKVNSKMDEIEILNWNFENMRERIDTLINHVYETQMAEMDSRLRFLQAQINPHFLYNTLESIRFTARLNYDEQTEKQIQALAYIMRGMLNKESSILLSDELEITQKYLFLQKERFGEMLSDEVIISPEAARCTVPRFILQPIVENSIEHGFSGENMKIMISAVVENEELVIRVRDNGREVDVEQMRRFLSDDSEERVNHIALYNIHKRLQLYYGKKYGLDFQKLLPKGVEVTLSMPKTVEVKTIYDKAIDC